MRNCCLTACLSILLLAHLETRAQDPSTGKTPAANNTRLDRKTIDSIERELKALFNIPRSYFSIGLNYLSNNVYFGRKDTVNIPYLSLSASYYHKSGLYVNVAASWLPESGQDRIDLVSAEAGYHIRAGKFEGQASAYTYFFSNQSNNVKADLKGTFSFFAGYDLGFVKPVLTPILDVSSHLDFAMILGLEHSFYSKNRALDVTPSFNVNASTQNYYNSYYHDRKFRIKIGQVITPVMAHVTGEVLQASAFKILDYEFIVPINYKFKKITINFTPEYAAPTNAATVAVTRTVSSANGIISSKTRTGKEKVSNSFFWQGGITMRF